MKYRIDIKRLMALLAVAMVLLLPGGADGSQKEFFCFPVYAEMNETASDIEYAMPSPETVLQRGSKGEDVRWLQAALNQAVNAGLTVDGDFGGGTEAAVKAFQEQQGLTADGIAGAETLQKLETIISGSAQPTEAIQPEETSPTEEDGPEEVKSVFLAYWKLYFGFLADTTVHIGERLDFLKAYAGGTLMTLCAVVVTVCILLVAVKFLDSFEPSGHQIYLSGIDEWMDVMQYKGSDIDIGSMFFKFLELLAVAIVLSPVFSDMGMIAGFGVGLWGCIWRAVLYAVLRLLMSVAVLIGGLYLFSEVIAIGLAVLAFPVLCVKTGFRKLFGRQKESARPLTKQFRHFYIMVYNSKITFYVMLTLLGLVVLVLNFLPDVMIFSGLMT